MSTYVTIGRNVGDKPMSDVQWEAFQRDIRVTLAFACGELYSWTQGRGYWEGNTEDTAIIVAPSPRSAHTNIPAGRSLLHNLGQLARIYGQEAILVTIAEPVFVAANPDTSARCQVCGGWPHQGDHTHPRFRGGTGGGEQ